jgi:ligand-binding sensor domain-containing protein
LLFSRRRVLFCSIFALLAVAFCSVAFIWQKAQRTLDESARQVTQSSAVPFVLSPVTPVSAPTGFRSFGVHGDFQAFALFDGDWMVCNRSALFRYGKEGQLLQTWRVGLELPAFPLKALAVRQGIPQPELWIATDGAGSLIWNGTTFRQLLPQAVPLRKETALLPLPDGRMLIGTLTAGLCVTDTRQFKVFRPELQSANITALALGSTSEEIWIGTRDQGVWLWRAGTLNQFLNELPDPQVLSLCSGDTGVWVGTVNGVAEFVDGHFQRRFAEGVLATALAESSGTLWISTIDEGILSVDLKAHLPKMSHKQSDSFHAVAIMPSKGGVIALGDSQIRPRPLSTDVLSLVSGDLTNGHITALNIDAQRKLWIGYFNRGLDLLGSEAGVKHLEDDVLFCINRIKSDEKSNRMFVATANGLVLFDMAGKPRQVLRSNDGLISNHVTDVLSLQTGQGTVIATNAGLTFMNGAVVSSVYAFQGLVNNHVYTIAQTGPTLLAGTLGGVSLLKNAVVQSSLTTANSNLSQNWITASAVMGREVFLGTYGSGVVHLTPHDEVQGYREFSAARIEINANAMLTTGRGIYAGTAGQGLTFLPKGDTRWRFWKSGLPSANVTALATDGENLYIGTDNGLVQVPERNLTL